MQGIKGRRRRRSLSSRKMRPELLRTLKNDGKNQKAMNSGGRKNNGLCRRGDRKSLGNFGLVALATFGRHIAHHGVLAVTLAAVFRHYDSATAFVEACKTRPGQKREESQECYAHCPEARFRAPFHDALGLLLSSPEGLVNLLCFGAPSPPL